MARAAVSRAFAGFEQLSARAIERWRALLAGCLGLCLLAVISWMKIPRLEDPRVAINDVILWIAYPGASPADVESRVLNVVERGLFELDSVEFIESRALPNGAQITIRFESGAPVDVLMERVRGRVAGKKNELPAEVKEPEMYRPSSAGKPALVVAVVGNRADRVLGDTAKRVRDELCGVAGVAGADLRGEPKRALRIRLDPHRLAQHHLTPAAVGEQLKAANVRAPGGEVDVGALGSQLEVDRDLSLDNHAGGVESLRALAITSTKDPSGATRTVRLGDIADVTDGERTSTEKFLLDGVPAVGVSVRFRQDEDVIVIGGRVREKLRELQGTLPKATSLRVVHDQSEFVSKSVNSFLESLGEGMLLVGAIIALGLGARAALVVAGVLPLAMAGAVVGLFGTGFALERISIAGLIVALGLLVDDAVVVAESIQVMRERGYDRVRAAVLGTARVFWANNGTTAVACASFIPLFFMGGTVGTFIRGLPAAVILSLVTSLLVAQLFTPWASLFMKTKPDGAHDGKDDCGAPPEREKNPALRWAKLAYAKCIPVVLRHPGKVTLGFTAVLVFCMFCLPRLGFEFFPKADKAVLFIHMDVARGTKLDATGEKLVAVLAKLKEDVAVVETSAVLGGAYPPIFPRAAAQASTDMAEIMVRATDGTDLSALATRLRASLAKVPGVRARVEELWEGPPVAHPIELRITGDSYETLGKYADDIESELRRIPGAINVTDSMSESIPVVRLAVDRARALRVGITPAQVGMSLRALHAEDQITELRDGVERVDVVLEQAGWDDAYARLEQTPIVTSSGTSVPLASLATVKFDHAAAEFRHRNTRRYVEVTADVDGATLPSQVLGALEPRLRAMNLAAGYSISRGGATEETSKSFRNLGLASGFALVTISLLLLWMFDSFLLATVVMAAVPFGLIGAVAGLGAARLPFGFMSFLGLIALIGVYINHKIYFVDRMRELVARGLDLPQAIAQAGIDRIRPVVLTALTAILGLLPLTLSGGVTWESFGWVNIFGLATSVPLSLLLLPALIVIAYRARAWLSQKFGTHAKKAEAFADATMVLPSVQRVDARPTPQPGPFDAATVVLARPPAPPRPPR